MKSGMKDYPTSLSRPIDSTAARVVSKGFVYTQDKKPNEHHQTWTDPPPTFPCPADVKKWIGTRHDRMRIVGYLGRTDRGAKWLARCDCGKYEVRNQKRWGKVREVYKDCCDHCKSFLGKKRTFEHQAHFARTGVWPDD